MFDAVASRTVTQSALQLHRRRCSPPGLVALDAGAALHHVLEDAQFLGVVATTGAKVALSSRFILGDGLGSESRASIVGLVLIEVFLGCFARGGLGKRPSWHVLFARG